MQLVLHTPTGPRRKQDIHYNFLCHSDTGKFATNCNLCPKVWQSRGLTGGFTWDAVSGTRWCAALHTVLLGFQCSEQNTQHLDFHLGENLKASRDAWGQQHLQQAVLAAASAPNDAIFALQHSMALCQCIKLLHYKAITGWENKVFQSVFRSPCPWC